MEIPNCTPAIFVHAGAGYHSQHNEDAHTKACADAAHAAMKVLRNGGSAVDAVEMATIVLEDREITNAGYGSNLTIDGVVECDASIVDHCGRSGAVGAVAQIKNPISLARLVYNCTHQTLTLRRVPPNLLVAEGAILFAREYGMPILPHDALVSEAALAKWRKWRRDLDEANRKAGVKEPSPDRSSDRSMSVSSVGSNTESTSSNSPEPSRVASDKELERIRKQHTKAMLGPVTGRIHRCQSPLSSDHGRIYCSSPSVSPPESPRWSPNISRTSTFESNVYVDPRGPPRTLSEASQNAFFNSTQKLDTLSSYKGRNEISEGSKVERRRTLDSQSSGRLDNDKEATSVGQPIPRTRPRPWHDGSSENGSDSSSSTLQLPSLTPSPPSRLPPDVPGSPDSGKPSPTHPATPPRAATMPAASTSSSLPQPLSHPEENSDHITDTVGVIAVDKNGNIACGASSGGIGLKYRGRVGPAALVGIGAAVIPAATGDVLGTCVAAVTSGTGEHITTTMAATVCAERLYHGNKKVAAGRYESDFEEVVVKSVIDNEFMGHPGVKNSQSPAAIGILAVKKDVRGIAVYYAHNTDSFVSGDSYYIHTLRRLHGKAQSTQKAVMYVDERQLKGDRLLLRSLDRKPNQRL